MRFSHILLATLALAAPISSQLTNQPCTNAPGECKSCVGTSNCCGDSYSVDYGHCSSSSSTNCPNGLSFTCNGENCPTSITCDFRADDCKENPFCWGTITCSGDCPTGYATGDFCYQDGTSEQFKVCGTGAASVTEAPTTAPTESTPTGGANPQPTEAVTEAPTTAAPATEAPTTEAPTTEAPTTEAPTTEAPTTEAPTTEAPTTEAPTNEAPTTEAPTTEAPTTEAPTTEAPTAYAPTNEVPTTEAPTTAAPTTEAPTTEAPTTAAPGTQAPATQAPTTAAPSTPTGAAPPNAGGEVPTPDNVVCYQTIVGSLTGTYAQVSADLDLWQQRMHTALNLTGPINLSVGHAQVPDRNSFENNCTGPYQTVADLFVHIQTSQDEYDAVSAALEAFIAANPVTSYTSISCAARSVTTYLPRCGKTDIDITFPTPRPNPQRNDAAVLCYQEVVGSLTGNYTTLNAELDAWQLKMYTELGLTGPIELTVGHAQIPDRVDFENNCTGPYAVMADLFIHIPTTYDQYDTLSARLAAFIAANPFTRIPSVSCSATSIVTFLPGCGKIPNPTTTAPAPASPQQPNYQYCPVVTYNHRVVDAGSVASGKKLYTVVYDVTSANQRITYVDVHITTASGFYNYRMSAASSTSYQLTFPSYLALDGGELMNYWFTTQSTSDAFPQPFACDSPSYNYTTSGTPIATNPTQPPVTVPCPSATFDYDVQRVGAGVVNGTSTYAITFTPTGNSNVDWVDVHLTANGGQFNYRMDQSNSTGFRTVLPSPHLNLRDGAALSYWYTYSANGTACDTGVYNTNVAAA